VSDETEVLKLGRARESTELRQQIDAIQAAIAKEVEKATQLELRAKYVQTYAIMLIYICNRSYDTQT
jgi:hypothetical protein